MSKKKQKKVDTGRDYSMVRLIQGATKAGVHKDIKKEDDKYHAREDVDMKTLCERCYNTLDSNPYETNGLCSLCYDGEHDDYDEY